MAATLAIPAADLCAQLNIQVHGGIGFTWEHDAHLYLRRATALESILDAEAAAKDVTDLVRARRAARRDRSTCRPRPSRSATTVRAFAERVRDLDDAAQRDGADRVRLRHAALARSRGAATPARSSSSSSSRSSRPPGIKRPAYGITGWVILTLIQHATDDQVARWVRPALNQEVIWCQLFSEPDAGLRRGRRQDEGDAGRRRLAASTVRRCGPAARTCASFGLATVRTNPDVPKHEGITTMVIDMHADGVEVRPLKMPTGNSEFNEVFFNDVFVPDDDVVGPVDGGWTVARATLGNESVSIGGGQGGMAMPADTFIAPLDAHPERLPGGAGRVGRYIANTQAIDVLNLRSAHRAVAGGGPGPEGNVTKLVLSENGHEAAAMLAALDRTGRRVPRRRRRDERHARADAPRHVDRRRHVGDQAQPDRRAHPRPAPRPADQVAARPPRSPARLSRRSIWTRLDDGRLSL